jgi:hypothetical protein
MTTTKTPKMYGAPVIRVTVSLTQEEREARRARSSTDLAIAKDHYFYDYDEAKQFVNAKWTRGKELDARVREGDCWLPIYLITATGDIYESGLASRFATSVRVGAM